MDTVNNNKPQDLGNISQNSFHNYQINSQNTHPGDTDPNLQNSFQNMQISANSQQSSKLFIRPKSVSDSIQLGNTLNIKESMNQSINQSITNSNSNFANYPTHQDKENFYPQAADLISRKGGFNSPGVPSNPRHSIDPANPINLPSNLNQNSLHSTSSANSTSSRNSLYSKFGPKPSSSQTLLFYFGKKDFKPPTRQECGDDPAQLHPRLIQCARQCSFDLIQKTVAKTCLFTVRSSQVRLFYRVSASSIEHVQIGFKNIVAVDSLEKSWLNIVTRSAKSSNSEVSYTCHCFSVDCTIHTVDEERCKVQQFIKEIQDSESVSSGVVHGLISSLKKSGEEQNRVSGTDPDNIKDSIEKAIEYYTFVKYNSKQGLPSSTLYFQSMEEDRFLQQQQQQQNASVSISLNVRSVG
jgi:hypothetical protein